MADLSCHCGAVHLRVTDVPFAQPLCYCNSCGTGGERLAALPVSPPTVNASGGTAYRLYHKDRVEITAGKEHLVGYILTPQSKTRRVVASCCNTPLFLVFSGAHWLSMYNGLWPDAAAYRPDFMTQTGDAPDPAALPKDIPHGTMTTLGFYAKVFGAWAAMGFCVPKVEVPKVLTL